MGGFGSGQRWSKKPVVEGCLTLDTADLKRMKMLAPVAGRRGSLEWRRGEEGSRSSSVSYSLTIGAGDAILRLGLQDEVASEETLNYPIRTGDNPVVISVVCGWWFLCPLGEEQCAVRSPGAETLPAWEILRLSAPATD